MKTLSKLQSEARKEMEFLFGKQLGMDYHIDAVVALAYQAGLKKAKKVIPNEYLGDHSDIKVGWNDCREGALSCIDTLLEEARNTN